MKSLLIILLWYKNPTYVEKIDNNLFERYIIKNIEVFTVDGIFITRISFSIFANNSRTLLYFYGFQKNMGSQFSVINIQPLFLLLGKWSIYISYIISDSNKLSFRVVTPFIQGSKTI